MPDGFGPPLLLDPIGQAVSAARRYVGARLEDLGATHLADSAELGVSELVTNAVLHTGTALTVTVRRTDAGAVRVEVADRSPVAPHQRRMSTSATTGRGLRLVAAVSADWGVVPVVDEHGAGKIIWFEPLPEPTAAGFAGAEWAADMKALLEQ
jgi:anti-sigma regulatory factor (Ser/Thr protein kinase)